MSSDSNETINSIIFNEGLGLDDGEALFDSPLLDILMKAQNLEQSDADQPSSSNVETTFTLNDILDKQFDDNDISTNILPSYGIDEEEKMRADALSLFNQAMSYKKQPIEIDTPRKYVKRADKLKDMKSTSVYNPMSPTFSQQKKLNTFYPRAKFEVDCTEFFEKDQGKEDQFKLLHMKLEEERSKIFDEQVLKDVDRLLSSANRVYGHREWSMAEKMEFSKFCRTLKTRGTLTTNEKNELKEFYAKAYNLKPMKNIHGEQDYVFITDSSSPLIKETTKRKYIQSKNVPAKKNKTSEDTVACSNQEIKQKTILEKNNSICDGFSFSPGARRESEKAFRDKMIDLFESVMKTDQCKKRGRPPGRKDDDEYVLNGNKMDSEKKKRSENIDRLLQNMNEAHGKDKNWTDSEKNDFEKYYQIFDSKQTLTLSQAKEMSSFFRKAYGELDQYEIERENDEKLKEKRKYWQEYRRQYYLNNKKAAEPVKTVKKTTVNDDDKKKRKAQYLREWRIKKALEKQEVLRSIAMISTEDKGEQTEKTI